MELDDFLHPIGRELKLVEKMLLEGSGGETLPFSGLIASLDDGSRGLRSAIVLLSSRFYPADRDKAITLGAAVEMLHTAILAHDALPPSGVASLIPSYILAGDYLLARAAVLVSSLGNVEVTRLFSQALMDIYEGLLCHTLDSHFSIDDYYRNAYLRTASLFAASAEAGALLSGAPSGPREALRSYGHNLGMAFHISREVEELAKGRWGAGALPTLLFLQRHPEKAPLLRGRGKAQELAQMIKESSAPEDSLAQARRFARRAGEALAALPPSRYRRAMRELAHRIGDGELPRLKAAPGGVR